MKEIKIHEPLYDVDISYLFGDSVSKLKEFIQKRHGSHVLIWDRDVSESCDKFFIEDTDGYQFHVQEPLGSGERFYSWMYKPTDNLLFHETLHITFDILFTRGVKYHNDSEEAFAYLGGMIFQQLKEKLNATR